MPVSLDYKEKDAKTFASGHYFKNIARSLGLDSLYGKVNVALSIEAKLENESIYLGNVHLSSGSESNEYTRRTRLFHMQKFCDRLLHGVTSSAPLVVISGDLNSAPYSKMYQYLMRPSEQDEDLDKVGKINYNLPKMVSAYGRVMHSSLFTEEVSDLRKKLVNNEPLTHIYGGRLTITLDYILFAEDRFKCVELLSIPNTVKDYPSDHISLGATLELQLGGSLSVAELIKVIGILSESQIADQTIFVANASNMWIILGYHRKVNL